MDGAHVEVDDLFGDVGTIGDSVTLNLPLEGVSAELLSRFVDDLHRSSSEQRKVAWSSSGCLAAVAPEFHSVCIRHLHSRLGQRRWQLSKEHAIDLSSNGDAQHPILQLEWSPSGQDLALADGAGRVTIVNVSTMALNDTTVVRPATLDREDELGQVLGFRWLNIERPQVPTYPTYIHAAKNDGKWTYMAAPRKPMGPFWDRAVCAVNRRGALLLHYQRHDGRWATAKTDLRATTTTGYLLTHAAIAPTQENKLLIVVQNSHRQILVYLATISIPDPKQENTGVTGIKISIENIQPSLPYRYAKGSDDRNAESALFEKTSNFLSYLEIVPSSEIESAVQQPPMILAFFNPIVNTLGMIGDGQLGVTTVKRWLMIRAERKLHPAFDSMPSTGNNSKVDQIGELRRLDDVHMDNIVTSVQRLDGSEQLALGTSDGSVALYDPRSLMQSYVSSNFTQIDNMSQGGLVFPSMPRGLDLSLSPNGCVTASLTNDGNIQLTHLEQSGELTFNSLDSAVIEADVAAIVLSFSRSVYLQTPANDITLLVCQHLGVAHGPHLIQSTLKNLFSDRDFMPNPEITQYTSKPILPRVLSLAASLGHDQLTGQRTRASMLSWLSLHIRSCTSISMFILLSVSKNGGLDLKNAEVSDIACNNVRWALDLCKFIVDELFEVDDCKNGHTEPGRLSHRLTETQSVMQLLLVSIWPRSLLRIIPRILRGFVRAIQDPKIPLSPAAAPAFSRMTELVESSSLKMEPLEHLLTGADKVIQQFFHLSGMSVQERADTERFILSHGQIPEVLQDALPKILQDVLPTQRTKIDRLSLYTHDYSWLGIWEDSKTKAFKRDYVVDVHRKTVLSRKGLGRVRKCVRCGSISTDLVRVKHWPQYLQMLMSRCVCGDAFAVVDAEDV